MTQTASSIITLTSNNMFVFTELMVIGFIAYWMSKPSTVETCKILTAWFLVGIGYFIRIGYWSIGMLTHDDSPTFIKCTLDMVLCSPATTVYPQWTTDYRGLLIVPAIMVLLGNLIFIAHIHGISIWTRYVMAVVIVLLSISTAGIF